jgi:krueppel-like factor 15
MSATLEDLASRLRQLERELQELAAAVSHRPSTPDGDLADRISFRAWMRISAPTFAVMALGFPLLWSAQQASSAQMLEMSRSLGRLDGAVASLEATTARVDQRLLSIDGRLASFDERLASFDARLASFDERLASFDERLASFDRRLASFDANLATLNRNVERLGRAVEKLESR